VKLIQQRNFRGKRGKKKKRKRSRAGLKPPVREHSLWKTGQEVGEKRTKSHSIGPFIGEHPPTKDLEHSLPLLKEEKSRQKIRELMLSRGFSFMCLCVRPKRSGEGPTRGQRGGARKKLGEG